MTTKVSKIVNVIKSALPERRPIHHHEPFTEFGIIERSKLHEASRPKSIISNYYAKRFEKKLQDVTGASGVLSVNSGTSAIHLALCALGINWNHEVLVPSLTFIGTVNPILYCNATPHFLDYSYFSDSQKLDYYLSKLDKLPNAIILVHLLGHPIDAESIYKVACKYDIFLIEDACQALGSRINNKNVGLIGDIGVFSFNNNKIVTTNGGGALIVKNSILGSTLLKFAHDLASTARKKHPWEITHTRYGYNYRMGNINAALGLNQLGNLMFDILSYKRKLYQRYKEKLDGLVEFIEPTIGESNYWLNTILVDEEDRDEIFQQLHHDGIYARALFKPLTELGIFTNAKVSGEQTEAISIYKRAICLPSGDGLL